MLDGIMWLWYALTIASLLFVAIDVWRTPEAPVLRVAFVVLTLFAGPIAAFFYVLACREPLDGTHERYVQARWRQVLGSTMHCAAGDGIGIIVGAAIGSVLELPMLPGFLLEYTLGFGFGWAFFQAYAMRDMAGGSYKASLRMTFLPELLSMNLLMTGMHVVSELAMPRVAGSGNPLRPQFWFVMSMALVVGFLFAYPVNWWLVANHMKHGMLTVRRALLAASTASPSMAGAAGAAGGAGMDDTPGMDGMAAPQAGTGMPGMGGRSGPSTGQKAGMTVLTFAILAAAVASVAM